MAVDSEAVGQVRERVARLPDSGSLGSLSTLAEVLAFAFTSAKAEGRDGLGDVALVLEAINQPRSRADRRRWDALRREARETLRALGYPEALTDMLKR